MPFDINKFDWWAATKATCLIVTVLFLLIYVPIAIDKYFINSSDLDKNEVTRIAENIVKVSMAENQKTFKEMLVESDSRLVALAKSNNELIKAIGEINVKIGSTTNHDTTGDYEQHTDGKDLDSVVIYRGKEKTGLPLATVWYSPDQPVGKRWAYQTHPLEYKATILETEKKDGTQTRSVEVYAENNFTTTSKGKKFPVPIDVKWEQNTIKDKSFSFNARLNMSMQFETKDIYPALDLSLFSYGKTDVDMDLKFLEAYVGGTQNDFYFGITPVSYNVGKFLPLVKNVFMGPSVSINSTGEKSFGASLSVPF